MPKLTKEMVDNLIREAMLNEDFPYTIPADKAENEDALFKGRKIASRIAAFDAIKGLEPEDSEVDALDFQKLIDDPSLIDTDMESHLIAISIGGKPDAAAEARLALNALKDALEAKTKDRQTITQPQIRSAGGAYGQFPSELNTIVNKLFSDPDFAARVEKVSKISNRFYNAAMGDDTAIDEIKNLPNVKFLAELMLLEYFVEMASSFTAEAGGDLFEWFLAALAGKRVLGASKKGADFELSDGSLGSAKYFAKAANMTQSPKGFKLNKKVTYYAALKKQGEEQAQDVKRGATQPARLQSFQIYKFGVEKTEEPDKFTFYNKEDQIDKSDVEVGDSINLVPMINNENLFTTIRIVDTKTRTFRQMLETGITTQNNAVKRKLLDAVESFFKSLEESNVRAKEYAVEGTPDKANATMTSLENSKAEFTNFQTAMDTPTPTTPVQENKQKKFQDLDKMIEELMLEHLQGNINDNN